MVNTHTMDMMEALFLGVVQGVTEFLPISSTAHLRVVPAILGWQDPGVAFTAVIQLGSLVALLAYFWRDLLQLGTGTITAIKERDFKNTEFRLSAAIILGTIPICVIGLALKGVLEEPGGPLRSLLLIGGASVFMGILLLLAERCSKRERGIQQLGVLDGLLVGLGQAIALIPGCSRSGSTLTVALFLNMKREDAARFSFMLGIPAVFLSGMLELKELLDIGLTDADMLSVVAGLASSTVVSYLAIWWLIKFLQKNSTMVFVGYRLAFGTAIIALAATGQIH